jgi:hypothetical protein
MSYRFGQAVRGGKPWLPAQEEQGPYSKKDEG